MKIIEAADGKVLVEFRWTVLVGLGLLDGLTSAGLLWLAFFR